MKKQMTRIDRSGAKLLPGAMALAATTAGAQAASVQITLTGNSLGRVGGNQLDADLTGDTIPDLIFGNISHTGTWGGWPFVRVFVNGTQNIYARESGMSSRRRAAFAGGGVGTSFGDGRGQSTYLNPISFTDARINGGVSTEGWLEVIATNDGGDDQRLELTRLIFDDASITRPSFSSIPGAQTEWVQVSAIPEPGGFVATSLLLGAAGLIRRRQARAA